MRGVKSFDLLSIIDFLYYGEANVYQEHLDTFLNNFEDHLSTGQAAVIQKGDFSGELEELDMIGRGENMIAKGSAMIKVYVCQVCGKEGASTTQIRDHIEANHIEGISIPCNSCQKAFRSRSAFRQNKCKMLALV